MKIQGIFRKLFSAKGLSVQLETPDGELIGKTTKFKGNKFNLKINTPKDEIYKGPINIVISDANGSEANFKKGGEQVDLFPDQQTFELQINTKKSKDKIKLKPKTSSSQNQDENSNAEDESKATDTWSLGEIKSLKTPGVSPHLESLDGGYRLSHTDIGMVKKSRHLFLRVGELEQ